MSEPEMTALIPMRTVESSNVAAIGYDPDTETFAVRFKGRVGAEDTAAYRYGGVPLEKAEHIFAIAANGGSVGKAVHRELVNRTPFPFKMAVRWTAERSEWEACCDYSLDEAEEDPWITVVPSRRGRARGATRSARVNWRRDSSSG